MMTSPEHYTELNDVFHSNYHNNELSLSWDNLRLKFRTKKILRGVTGIAQPGELNAIMGPSGCGKTSLLNVLSSRKILSSKFQSSGTIKLNSTPINSQNRSNFIKYVMASSLLIPTLTPYESLYFSASFHFHLSTSEINSKVSEILEKFKISHVAHSLIGNEW
jgi:ABC-type multidrug transport system ATPase subunit